jgi:hypothetical protein
MLAMMELEVVVTQVRTKVRARLLAGLKIPMTHRHSVKMSPKQQKTRQPPVSTLPQRARDMLPHRNLVEIGKEGGSAARVSKSGGRAPSKGRTSNTASRCILRHRRADASCFVR